MMFTEKEMDIAVLTTFMKGVKCEPNDYHEIALTLSKEIIKDILYDRKALGKSNEKTIQESYDPCELCGHINKS